MKATKMQVNAHYATIIRKFKGDCPINAAKATYNMPTNSVWPDFLKSHASKCPAYWRFDLHVGGVEADPFVRISTTVWVSWLVRRAMTSCLMYKLSRKWQIATKGWRCIWPDEKDIQLSILFLSTCSRDSHNCLFCLLVPAGTDHWGLLSATVQDPEPF